MKVNAVKKIKNIIVYIKILETIMFILSAILLKF